jgi:photosystem II stability/assembly factor-like uncharacterized protein
MLIIRYLLLTLLIILSLGACKKDLLQLHGIQQLNSYTNTDKLNRIFFIDSATGFIVGGQRFYTCTILKTTDGGYTWNKFSFPDAGKCLYGICQSPSGTLYTVGFDGKILSSGNKGANWAYFQSQYLPYLDIGFFNSRQGIILSGVSFNEGFRILVDSVGNFIRKDSLAIQYNRIKVINNTTAYICGYGAMQKTTDAGQTWQYLTVGGNDNFVNMDIHSENDIWLCGNGGGVFHTTDGGNSWATLRNGNDIGKPRYQLLDIVFKTDNINGWAVGENGLLIHTDDGGHHWEEYQHFTDNALRSIFICTNGDLIVSGDNGALYRLQPN